jgi:hypothetical protein
MEIWKKIKNFEDYEISSLGRVRCGNFIMKCQDNGLGYKFIRVSNNGFRQRFYIHRLVMIHFRPTTKNVEVNHIDHDKSNNQLENLEWVTRSENMLKAVAFLGKEVFCKK